MKLPIAMAALFLAATAALPAAAAAPTGHSFYMHEGRSLNLRHGQSPYRTGFDAYAQAPAPRASRPAAGGWDRQAWTSGGHCVSGLASEAASAYPSWELCQDR